MRSANDELSRGVDIILYIICKEAKHFLTKLCLHPWHEYLLNILLYP